MIISHGRKFIFVHIPKTGGTSMALALEDRAMRDDLMLGDTPKARKRRRRLHGVEAAGRLWKHSTLADIHGLVNGAEIAEYFTFTLVRNPWDRMVSYYHWLQVQSFDHPAVARAKALGFEAFCQDQMTLDSLRMFPARQYMTDARGIERCDAYIRIEAFDQDAASLKNHLGFDLVLPRANASVRADTYQSYFTPASRDAVAQACAEDIARFAYRFD